MRIAIVLSFLLMLIAGCSVSETENPLLKGQIRLHDPSGIVEDKGYLVTFATGSQIRMNYLSPGSHEWLEGKGVFQAGEKPEWIEDYIPGNKGFWAPHAPFPRVLYYSVADDSDGKDIACIGRATAQGAPPNQVWIDDGKPVLVCDRDVDTEPFAIDPAIFEGQENTLWMVYGSHWSGIWIIELDPDTGHIKDSKAREQGWTTIRLFIMWHQISTALLMRFWRKDLLPAVLKHHMSFGGTATIICSLTGAYVATA
jgi:arabinan endo-1,5-alpha-L-arabinosidase